MKIRNISTLVVTIGICLATTMSVMASSGISVDNIPLSGVTTYIKEGSTMVPLRVLSEEFGCKVSFDSANKVAIVNKQDTEFRFPIGNKFVTVNGNTTKIETPAEIKDGSTMVPLRFVVEALGGNIEFDKETKSINVTTDHMAEGDSSAIVGDVDVFGNEIRTTDLPNDSYIYPWIREDVPNWVYNTISKTMNHNVHGPNDTGKLAGKRFMAQSPKDLWNSTGHGEEMWFEEFTDVKTFNGWNIFPGTQTFQDMFDETMTDWLNNDTTRPDYKQYNIDRATRVQAMFSHYTLDVGNGWTGIRTQEHDDFIGNKAVSYGDSYITNNINFHSEFTPLYEAAWRPTNYDGISINVPIHVKLTIDSMDKTNPPIFGGSPVTGSSSLPDDAFGYVMDTEVELVYTVKMIKQKDGYRFDFNTFDLLCQASPAANYHDSLHEVDVRRDLEAVNKTYPWTRKTKEGGMTITNYQDFDSAIADRTHHDETGRELVLNHYYTYEDIADNGVVDNPIIRTK